MKSSAEAKTQGPEMLHAPGPILLGTPPVVGHRRKGGPGSIPYIASTGSWFQTNDDNASKT